MMNEERLTLAHLDLGDRAVIRQLIGDGSGMERLREMGLHPGTTLRVVKFAPWGDPIAIQFRGYYLTLARSLALQILVDKS